VLLFLTFVIIGNFGAVSITTLLVVTITTSLIHSGLDYCNSLFQVFLPLRLIVFNSFSMLVLSSEHQNSLTFSPVLKPLHWLKINERIQLKILFLTYTKFFELINRPTCVICSLFCLSQLSIRSLSIVTLLHSPSLLGFTCMIVLFLTICSLPIEFSA
jgi:hypothetical protein